MDLFKDFFDSKKKEKEKILKNAYMEIKGNAIYTKNTIIQLSNVTDVYLGDVEKEKFDWRTNLIIFIIGLALTFAFPLFILLILLPVYNYYVNFNQEQIYALTLQLNNYMEIRFTSENKESLNEAKLALGKAMEDSENLTNYIGNFGSGNIINASDNSNVQVTNHTKGGENL